jgi:O-acetyl-ADP-ribose deacetylase (regulator of RNase III)
MPFQIIRNDITKVEADAIVNTANPIVTYAGAVDRSIYLAAGAEELLKEREKIGPIHVGEAAYTPAFKLHAKYIMIRSPKVGKSRLRQLNNACSLTTEYSL